jgi:hypothetical protein
MLFAHLTVFLASIAFLLFAMRYKQQIMAEKMLTLFSLIYLLNTTMFLSYQYYGFDEKLLLDLSGVITELLTLTMPVAYLLLLGWQGKKWTKSLTLLTFLLFVVGGTIAHFYIADNSGYLFYHENRHAKQNVELQIIVDLIILIFFLFLFTRVLKQKNQELFDGDFKTSIGIVFIGYYLQDLIVLGVMAYFTSDKMLNEMIFYFGNTLNFLIVLMLVYLSIQTNWLKEWHMIKKSIGKSRIDVPQFEITTPPLPILKSQLAELDVVDFQNIKAKFQSDYTVLFENINALNQLSKTEKMYLFFLHFEIPHKDLADVLHVSIRTIETNFYRVRKKIQKQPL